MHNEIITFMKLYSNLFLICVRNNIKWCHELPIVKINYFWKQMFRSSHFSFLVFGHFWQRSYENTKILRNLSVHFARQDEQDRKNPERKSRNLSDQNTKNQKNKT